MQNGGFVNKIQGVRLSVAKIHRHVFENPGYIVDAITFRTWEEEIYNTQKYAKAQQQVIFFEDEEPEYCLEDDVWLGV